MADETKAPGSGAASPAADAAGEQVPTTASSVFAPVVPDVPDTGYTSSGVPTLEGVRDKIENRLGTALGATELAESTPEARTAATRYEARQRSAAEKLEEIRASMREPD